MTIGLNMASALDSLKISFLRRGSEVPAAMAPLHCPVIRGKAARKGNRMVVQDRASAPLWPALVAVNIAALIFGTTALFGRIEASPVWIVAGRGFFACAALWAVAA